MLKLLELWRIQEGDSSILFWLKELLVAVLVFALFYLLSRVVNYLLEKVAPRFTAFTSTDLDDRILKRVTPPVTLVVVFAGLYYACLSLPLPDRVKVVAGGVLFIANVIIITNIVYRAIEESLKWYAVRKGDGHAHTLNVHLLPVTEKLTTIFLCISALIVVLKHFNYDILSLVTALGVGSLAIGMAAKDTLANMISGFTIMIDRPFRIGDRIQLAKGGMAGDVIDIGLRSTKIKNPDNTLLIIPNSDLCNSTVVNMNLPDVRGQGKIEVRLQYGPDPETVKRVMREAALEIPEVLREPAPNVFLTTLGETGLLFMLIFWTENYTTVFGTADKVNCLLLRRLQENDLHIAAPAA